MFIFIVPSTVDFKFQIEVIEPGRVLIQNTTLLGRNFDTPIFTIFTVYQTTVQASPVE